MNVAKSIGGMLTSIKGNNELEVKILYLPF